MCLESDSKTDVAYAGVFGVGELAQSGSGPATPLDRKIWEDVVPAASREEAMSPTIVE